MTEETYKLDRETLLRIKIPYGSNKVLIQTLEKNTEAVTPSGIYKIASTDTDWDPATHATRWGRVVCMPRKLKKAKTNEGTLPWDAHMELQPGMLVWYDYMDSLNCVTYNDDMGNEYKLIEYANLYVGIIPVGIKNDIVDERYHTKTVDGEHWVIPLNGYVLFEKVQYRPKTIADIYIQEKNDPKRGKIVYLSRPNKSYLYNQESDDIDLQVGDICVFAHSYEVMLEHPTYSVFDGGNGHKYKRMQRKMIMMAYRGDEIVLPKDKVIVRQKADKLTTTAGLELLKKHDKNKEAFVLESTYDEVKKGDEVIYPTGSGVVVEYKGEKVRLLDKNHLLARVL